MKSKDSVMVTLGVPFKENTDVSPREVVCTSPIRRLSNNELAINPNLRPSPRLAQEGSTEFSLG